MLMEHGTSRKRKRTRMRMPIDDRPEGEDRSQKTVLLRNISRTEMLDAPMKGRRQKHKHLRCLGNQNPNYPWGYPALGRSRKRKKI